jgi:hypothetical protein
MKSIRTIAASAALGAAGLSHTRIGLSSRF